MKLKYFLLGFVVFLVAIFTINAHGKAAEIERGQENNMVNIAAASKFAGNNVRIPILMYHHLLPKGASAAEISPERFREHMMAIKKKGYTTITDKELLDFLEGKGKLPNKPILITLDDGYRSNYLHAYPVLKELGMKATVYLITSRVVEGKNKYPNEIPKFSWDEAKKSLDVFSFQGHTYDFHYKGKNSRKQLKGMITGRMMLPNGRLESQIQYQTRVLRDLSMSKKIIEDKLGTEVITLAYPFGEYSEDTIRLAKKAGYKLGLTVKPGVVGKGDNLFTLNRITANGNLTGQELLKKIEKYE
ncbi:polysaccharide deacetylase family protein [Robertmurraya andreesenii]|uniref:Peptidoglycan/xylan/chitin deacetylase (PgdA/CDA1 family) n=1 Tax=Anoxybacillus andreesenii TaxID=1325932 RepID=A0ABT9UZV2_9BACL|nr:polysaccharide deacetylase family protein [Robertmurraya andreesenii]MDQ0154216.1 peptidoglycan/xylan/chitin deacetylase (PgdA/CDA1 family) [Robertmurraya andreesenii]